MTAKSYKARAVQKITWINIIPVVTETNNKNEIGMSPTARDKEIK
jgi:hypothetical protein